MLNENDNCWELIEENLCLVSGIHNDKININELQPSERKEILELIIDSHIHPITTYPMQDKPIKDTNTKLLFSRGIVFFYT